MKRLAREALPSLIAALAATGVLAVLPALRNNLWNVLAGPVNFSLGLLLLMVALSAAFGGLMTYRLLRNSLELGKTDAMTKTLRADQIDAFLEHRLGEATSTNGSFAVLLVDIDDFKTVNEEHNHEIANRILAEFVDIIRPRSKGEEIFRYGGDEFLIVTAVGVDERAAGGTPIA